MTASTRDRRGTPSLTEAVALAVRAHRRNLSVSQRAYADLRGWTKTYVARMETRPGSIAFANFLAALDGTGFALSLGSVDIAATPWPDTEMLARDRGGRRFPAHRQVRHTPHGPRWFWLNEAADATSRLPQWSTEGLSDAELDLLHAEYLRLRRERHAERPSQSSSGRSAPETTT